MSPRTLQHSGFTLIELVIVILLSGILSIVVMQFITAPIDTYVDQSRRARLVDQAQSVMQRIAQDVRLAVPNSIRVGCGGSCMELLRAVTGGRYRALPPGDPLSFLPVDADTTFEVLGRLGNLPEVAVSSDPKSCEDSRASCLVIYNTGFADSDFWAGDNAATVTAVGGTPLTTITFDNTRFAGGQKAFPAQSPGQRFYLTDTPVSFHCDSVQREMRRYWGYSRMASHAAVDTHAELIALANPAEHALVSDALGACHFEYSPGTPTRNALLTLRVTLTAEAETVTLFDQFSIGNLP
jgi:MSHA biogenesis protein MshO